MRKEEYYMYTCVVTKEDSTEFSIPNVFFFREAVREKCFTITVSCNLEENDKSHKELLVWLYSNIIPDVTKIKNIKLLCDETVKYVNEDINYVKDIGIINETGSEPHFKLVIDFYDSINFIVDESNFIETSVEFNN